MDLGEVSRLLHRRIGGAHHPVADVVADGVVEEDGVLRHHADGGAQGVLFVIPIGHSCYRYWPMRKEVGCKWRQSIGVALSFSCQEFYQNLFRLIFFHSVNSLKILVPVD